MTAGRHSVAGAISEGRTRSRSSRREMCFDEIGKKGREEPPNGQLRRLDNPPRAPPERFMAGDPHCPGGPTTLTAAALGVLPPFSPPRGQSGLQPLKTPLHRVCIPPQGQPVLPLMQNGTETAVLAEQHQRRCLTGCTRIVAGGGDELV